MDDHTPAAAPSAPAPVDDTLIFAIIYDDYDRRHEIVHTEVAARARFARISDSWNAHLFVKVASNSRDDRHANSNAAFHRASAPAPAEVPMPEPYATLHHDDGYFTTKTRDDGKRPRPFRTDVVTLEQCGAYAAAREAAERERVRGVLRQARAALVRLRETRAFVGILPAQDRDDAIAAIDAELGEGR